MKTKTRGGEWIQTFTGKAFWPTDPDENDVCLEDIAHALSCQCRFAGHSRVFYSVAQHSVLVSQVVPERMALRGLLHDASEAYLVDLPTPLKRTIRLGHEYKKIESKVMAAIGRKFGINPVMPDSIKDADRAVMATEVRDLLNVSLHPWSDLSAPLKHLKIEPWSSELAERKFLEAAHRLIGSTS